MRNKRHPWDLSQLSAEEMDELRHILNRRRCRLSVPDGLDSDNQLLNGIRLGLYEDMSHPAPRSPEIPAEYAEPMIPRIVKMAGLVILAAAVLLSGILAIGSGYRNIILYVGLGLSALLLGSMARK